MRPPTQKEHFDRIAHEYDESIPRHVQEHYLEKRLRFFGPFLQPGGWVCSVGAGTGSLEIGLMKSHRKVLLADQSLEMCRLAKAKGLPFILCADAAHLPIKPGRMGLCYSVAAFHHIIKPEKVSLAVREMHRIISRDGAMIIWDHNLRNPYWKIIMEKVPQDSGDERIVPFEEFRGHLSGLACRWSVAYSGWVPDFVPKSMLRAVKAIEWLLERMPGVKGFSAHNVFTACKT